MTYPMLVLLNEMMRNDGLTLAFLSPSERRNIQDLVDAGLASTDRVWLLKRAKITDNGVNAIFYTLG